jgi:hypothetical protein
MGSIELPPDLREDYCAIEEAREQTQLSPTSNADQAEGRIKDRNPPEQQSSDLLVIRLLQQRIAKLEREKKQVLKSHVEEEEASRVQVIYMVNCHKRGTPSYFLDEPLEYGDNPNRTFHLHGQKPFPNDIDLFIERQRGALSFLVYKELQCCKLTSLRNEDSGASIEDVPIEEEETPKIKETIAVTSKNLHDAFVFLKKRYPEGMKYFPDFKVASKISSPFLFYYNKRSFMMSLDELPEEHLSQVKLLREHIESSFRDEFARVDALTSKGNITAQFLAYLFEPGTVVIERKGGAYAGYEQTNWPGQQSRSTQGLHVREGDESSKAVPHVDKLQIQGQYWSFDGEFSMNWKEMHIDFGDPKPRVKPIKDLTMLPLRFAGFEVGEELRRRGSIFWSCRVRKFVSYNIDRNVSEEKVRLLTTYL